MPAAERPLLLEAMCLLSFIGCGAGFIMYFVAGIFFKIIQPYIIKVGSVPHISRLSSGYFLAFSMLFAISLFGVYKMWKLKITGFFIYMTARLAIVSLPLIIMGPLAFSSVAVIISLLFISLYASQIRRMKNYSPIN